ncbi:MAG: DNA gyrase subunit A [Parcubacteria group bacterium Greene0714_21]|nr:MAG: DNA gyrase subunit A [Parcubacteria group bacterium Greene0416_39]TSC98199.1 MAG: DNA gyrase subunit A [Parcubacteria group bacterium Greene1014_47]TSD04068.1 MAG: DNA gyrase subunit A [Parcubacteria group bacterium Greene0714_21]
MIKENKPSAIGKVEPREIVQEMKTAYLDYAMSVIVARALPDVRDGLKPVHRRILYAMYEMGLTHGAKLRKSAGVVGEVLGKYHPHGDISVYDALVRMAQDFSMRYPLIDGQGNFGCFTKDTEIQLTDGRALSFGQLIEEQKKGERHWTFSFNQKEEKIEIAEIKRPRLTRENAELVEVVLDNGAQIRCTPDHRFMLQNGTYQEARYLSQGDFLMSMLEYTKNKTSAFEAEVLGVADSTGASELSSIPILANQAVLSSVSTEPWTARELHPSTSGRQLRSRDYPPPTAPLLYLRKVECIKVNNVRFLEEKTDVYDITVDPWHNFALAAGIFVHNSIDDDPAAAMRYTESRMSRAGEELLEDIEKNTVDFIDTYDGMRQEPKVLPSPLPQLLLNGTLGIAVGMATNIPPHNLAEVADAVAFLIENPKADTEDLFQFIKGPDFPTGGTIFNKQEMIAGYSQGKGPIVVRGKAEVVENDKKNQIIISEIPFQVTKSTLVEQFANLVQEKKIEGIRDIRDESDKDGMRIVFDLAREAQPQKILNRLYKFSDLQKTFHLNLLALVDGIQPKVLSLAEILLLFLEHRRNVVSRRTQWELDRAKERAHILEGLVKCLGSIDEVIKIIRRSDDRDDAKKNLMARFKLTEIQANAILDTKLSQLAKLERKKIEEELVALKATIKELTLILANPKEIDRIIAKELEVAKAAYGDQRRTKVVVQGLGEIAEEDLIPQEDTVITLTQGGYIKRINPATYKIQKRGGKGIVGMKTMGEDIVEHFLYGQTHDSLMVFTDSGKVFQIPVYEVAEGTRVSKGRGLLNFIDLTPQDKVLTLFAIGKEDIVAGKKYLAMITKDGIMKKTLLDDFKNVRRSGLIAVTLKKGDRLQGAQKTTGEDDIIIVTKHGKSIRFKESQVRAMGRQAAGIHAIRLKKGDEVMGMDIIPGLPSRLFILSENGYGKSTDVKEYRIQSRGGSGIKTANVTSKTGNLVFAKVLEGPEEDLIVISRKGQVIRTPVTSIPKISRSTQGVRFMRLDEGDKVVSAACM